MGIIHLAYGFFFFFLLWKLINACLLSPFRTLRKLRKNGLRGPTPNFPMGNLGDMKKMLIKAKSSSSSSSESISHDIHSSSLPYFSQWKNLHGNVFVYWMGVEPFLYIADPEFLKQMSGCVLAKNWGKPSVFKSDRMPMFGEFGLNMIEGHTWTRHRHIITPAFSSINLKGMANCMVESTTKMISQWTSLLANSSKLELDMEKEVTSLAGEIIAKTNFGIESKLGNILFEKLRAMQISLFKHTRYVGVPFGQFLAIRQTIEARRLGQEIDDILLSIINARRKLIGVEPQHDFLGLLLESEEHVDGQFVRRLTNRELIDECKTFFFGGHETVALAMTWTLMLLAMYPKWQHELREEIKEVIGDNDNIDFTMLSALKKMGWVFNEVLRLYPSSPNAQRQARSDIQVGDRVIPNGTNIWIDVVGMHHDRALWGDDVNEFKPERFDGDLYGGCKHKMGYLPFGFGGRMCIGKNYAVMEYKIVMSIILRQFSFTVAPSYRHSPMYFFSFKPSSGMPLIVESL
ncbi:cytokinin hydroxylase-like [Amaranthus tricolor]|uniref:cytokinin hydroxylase-like n=1 Tax=Amaranthus tricolor TaxID=29722 RepID=UPI00258FA18A|nr:cytokinin hydroxylase-like [Amaranthus tricolor]